MDSNDRAAIEAITNVIDNGEWFLTSTAIATAALAALRDAGFAVVPLEPTPEAVGAWWRVKNGHHFSDEPPPTDTSDYAAYRALVRAAAKLPPPPPEPRDV